MSTEYRRGIPSTAHVGAATRLGLLWQQADAEWREWRFEVRGRDIWCDFAPWDPRGLACLTEDNRVISPARAMGASWRPIRPDGTPVDWEVLDQEIARVGQQGQSQGFRATLFGTGRAADFLTRWTVYQELKPLYDLVDGAQGEAAMPRDVYNECRARAGWTGEADDRWLLRYNSRLEAVGIGEVWHGDGHTSFERANMRNFAAVLDAVAERRVVERMRGQAPAPTVTSERRVNVEPRRFADVRPDRHGWRWWRDLTTGDCFTIRDGVYVRWFNAASDPWSALNLSTWLDRTVIPTDEQGNPVSWETIVPVGMVQSVDDLRERGEPLRPDQFSNDFAASAPITAESFARVLQQMAGARSVNAAQLPVRNSDGVALHDSLKQQPLPRFTIDELDDVDHSKTTKLDEVTLRRGKLPTVEQIAKYREVRARRTGGTVADALKESRIDCEVAQYVLERWVGGLGDAESLNLIRAAAAPPEWDHTYQLCATPPNLRPEWVDSRISAELSRATLDISEKPSPTVQRERQEAEDRRQRLAELRQRLVGERAAQPQEMAKKDDTVSRFDLIEPDPQADPAASIRAWEARQAAAKVRPMVAPPRIVKPAAMPRRSAIDVVDAEVDGLSRSEAFAALFGRALNGGC